MPKDKTDRSGHTPHTAFRLAPDDLERLDRIKAHHATNATEAVRLAIKAEFARVVRVESARARGPKKKSPDGA